MQYDAITPMKYIFKEGKLNTLDIGYASIFYILLGIFSFEFTGEKGFSPIAVDIVHKNKKCMVACHIIILLLFIA